MKKYYRVCTVYSDYSDRVTAVIDKKVWSKAVPESHVQACDTIEWDYDWFGSIRKAKKYIREVAGPREI